MELKRAGVFTKGTRPLCCHSIFWLPSKNQDWKSGQLLTITATCFEKVKPVFLFPKIHTSNEDLLVAVKGQVLKAKDFKLRPCSSKGSPGPAHLSETQDPNQDGVSKALLGTQKEAVQMPTQYSLLIWASLSGYGIYISG